MTEATTKVRVAGSTLMARARMRRTRLRANIMAARTVATTIGTRKGRWMTTYGLENAT